MEISTVTSKRHRRIIGVSYIEHGLPNVEIILNGKRINTVEEVHKESSLLKIPFNVKLFHRNLFVRKFTSLLSNLQNLPYRYDKVKNANKTVEKVNVKKLIIGGGTAGILSLGEETLLISKEIIWDIEYDESPLPQIERNEVIKKLKEKITEFENKIIKGTYVGKFDEGLLFETDSKFLLVNAENIIVASGGRTLRPIFRKNYLPGIVSRELYLKKLKKKYNKIIVLGFTNTSLRTALNAEKSTLIFPKGVKPIFSKFYLEKAKEKDIQIVEGDIVDVKNEKDKIEVVTNKGEYYGDLIVFSTVKQPRVEITYNLGLQYSFNKTLHIYQPQSNEKIRVIGGNIGLSNDFLSILSVNNTLDLNTCRELDPGVCEETIEQTKSPYLYSEDGMVCECEDLDMKDISFALNLGFSDVESIKRVTGLGTGHCQGKVCSYLAGSVTKNNVLISFRSPLYPVII